MKNLLESLKGSSIGSSKLDDQIRFMEIISKVASSPLTMSVVDSLKELKGIKKSRLDEVVKKQDEELLNVYMKGFNDELEGKPEMSNFNPLVDRAYNLGRDDAIIGDEASSSDSESSEDIINRIRSKKY